jgi:hypothetical protein
MLRRQLASTASACRVEFIYALGYLCPMGIRPETARQAFQKAVWLLLSANEFARGHLIAFGKGNSRAVVLRSGKRHKKLPVRNIGC